MGWCSGTEIFDVAVRDILKVDLSDKTKIKMIVNLIGAMWNHDWDCECDSMYFQDKLVKKAFHTLNPEVYEK